MALVTSQQRISDLGGHLYRISRPVEACVYLLAWLHTPRTCDILGWFPTLRANLGYHQYDVPTDEFLFHLLVVLVSDSICIHIVVVVAEDSYYLRCTQATVRL